MGGLTSVRHLLSFSAELAFGLDARIALLLQLLKCEFGLQQQLAPLLELRVFLAQKTLQIYKRLTVLPSTSKRICRTAGSIRPACYSRGCQECQPSLTKFYPLAAHDATMWTGSIMRSVNGLGRQTPPLRRYPAAGLAS